ncbi:MAG: hypothetical protein H0V75_03890 [Rubrobacter sp.]|nr:hypothetical protein [Rubrobacter sp.]
MGKEIEKSRGGASEAARRAAGKASDFIREEAKSAIPAARRAAALVAKVFERNSGGSIVGGR